MPIPSYKRAVEWLAFNDETAETDAEIVASLIGTLLVADLWGKEPIVVAKAVLRRRVGIKPEFSLGYEQAEAA